MARIIAYTERPSAKRAQLAWDHFLKERPPGRRKIELSYSPNIDGFGPGWIWELGHLENDTLHWHGGHPLIYTCLSGNLR